MNTIYTSTQAPQKYRFAHDGGLLWDFYYYGEYTGSVIKHIPPYHEKKLKTTYTITIQNVFWHEGLPDAAGDIELSQPTLGESKIFLKENALAAKFSKEKYRKHSHMMYLERYAPVDCRGGV